MAINKNHEFEELDGAKCAIVERNASQSRVDFLRPLLEFNRYTVVVIPTPVKAPPAATPVATAVEGEAPVQVPPAPETFTIGVSDTTFNSVNAIFGRLLKTPSGHVVTLAYWEQQELESRDDVPYFEN